MIWTNYKFKNTEIEKESDNYNIYLLDNINPRWLESSDTNLEIPNYHWVVSGWTFSRWRTIPLEWIMESKTWDKSWFWEAITFLDNLFALQGNPVILQLEDFLFTDDEWNNWNWKAKVKTPIEYELFEDDSFHFLRRWRVVLFIPEWRYFSKDEVEQDWWESWFINWISFIDGVSFSDYWVSFNKWSENLIFWWWNIWNQPVFPKIEITLLDNTIDFIKIKNYTTLNYIIIENDYNSWDIIIFDFLEEIITKNWVSILWDKTLWDFFEFNNWDQIEIYDTNERYLSNKINYKIFYKNILL